MNVALDNNFAMPGDAGFPLNQAFEAPKERSQAEVMRGYIAQMRQELAARLLERLYADGEAPSKVSLGPFERRQGSWLSSYDEVRLILLFFFTVVAELLQAEIHGESAVSDVE